MKKTTVDLLRLFTVAALASLVIACTSSTSDDAGSSSDRQDQGASSETVTIYIAEMVDRLELL